MEAPQAETLPAAAPPQEDLSKYDSRRAIARAVDGIFVGAPFLIPVLGLGFALSVALVAICLLYFFVCEALWGQTLGKRILGLRVLMRDGRPATASAVSARTVLRLIDDGPLGLVVMILSGRRRQRLGDLLGGTIVARATPGLPHAELSPLMIVYPIAWAIGAMALVLVPQPENDYLARVDQVCQQRREAYAATPRDQITIPVMVRWVHADHRAIASLAAPPEVTELRRQVLALSRTMVTTIDQAVARAKASPDPAMAFQREVSEIQAREFEVDRQYAQLGLKTCAGQPA